MKASEFQFVSAVVLSLLPLFFIGFGSGLCFVGIVPGCGPHGLQKKLG
jgi:hypothetical protein